MSVAAIIVNYYTSKYLPDLINDLVKLKEIDQVFVVDNSGEVEASLIQRQLSREKFTIVELLKPGKNIGFGAGINLAAVRASSEYFLVINPDVRLFPGCLDSLLSAARRYGAVLTGPRFYWDEKKNYRLPPSQGASSWLDYAFDTANSNRLQFEHLSYYWQVCHERFWDQMSPFVEMFLSGACLLVQRQWAMKNDSNVFDERFFLYYEDNDISLRALFDGVPPLCIPTAEALHYYDQSPAPNKSKGDLMTQSFEQFCKKYYGNVTFHSKKTDHYLPEINDIGQINTALSLDLNMFDPVGSLYFEIGVNPLFVPFVQTEFLMGGHGKTTGVFVLDENIWSRLTKGNYYGRLRDSIKGTLKIWKWEKL